MKRLVLSTSLTLLPVRNSIAAKLPSSSVQEASAGAAFWLVRAPFRGMEAFLIKHVHQQQTLDFCI